MISKKLVSEQFLFNQKTRTMQKITEATLAATHKIVFPFLEKNTISTSSSTSSDSFSLTSIECYLAVKSGELSRYNLEIDKEEIRIVT